MDEATHVSEDTPQKTTPGPARRRPAPGFFFPLLLIAVGVLLLLQTSGLLPGFAWWRLWVLWPVLLVMIGLEILLRRAPAALRFLAALAVVALLVLASSYVLGRTAPGAWGEAQRLSWPADETRRGEVQLNMGAGQLTVEPLGDVPDWIQAEITGPLREPRLRREGDTARLEIDQGDWRWGPASPREGARWSIALAGRVPVGLDVNMGVGEGTLNLSRLNVSELRLNVGVGDFDLALPGGGESGTVRVRIRAGVGSVAVRMPEGVAAQIRVRTGLGSASVDERAFPGSGGLYRSANYDTATYRLDVEVDVGIGSIEVR